VISSSGVIACVMCRFSRRDCVRFFVLFVAPFMLLVLLYAVVANGATLHLTARYWEWSPDAPHHAAVIQVLAGDRGGTGVIVRSTATRCAILSAHHVTQRMSTIRIVWPAGTSGVGTLAGSDPASDLSLIYLGLGGWTPRSVVVATAEPKPGDRLEVCGYGGPTDDTLRHFWVTATDESSSRALYSRGNALNGDSGGALFNTSRELVGILQGGTYRRNVGIQGNGTSWAIHYPIRSSNVACVRGLLQRAGIFPGIRPRVICPPGGS